MHHAVVLTEDAFDFGHDFAPNLLACYHRLERDESELLHGKSDPRNLLLGDSRELAIAVNDSITIIHLSLFFPFWEPLVTVWLLSLPLPCSLESLGYELFPGNLLSPSGL